MHHRAPFAVRIHATAARVLLPRDLYTAYGTEIRSTFASLYRDARRSPERRRLLRREIHSLLATAWRERVARTAPPTIGPLGPSDRRGPSPRRTTSPYPTRSHMLDDLLNDVRYAARSMRKTPTFTAVALVTLALAIGANTAVFSVVNGVLLQPLPYTDPQDLVVVWTNFGTDLPQNWISTPEFVEMRDLNTTFASLAVVYTTTIAFTGRGEPEQITGGLASGEIFDVLRVEAARGRLFGPADDVPGGERVAVISHGFWQRRFGGDPRIIGRDVNLGGDPFTVVGILPRDFVFLHPDVPTTQSVDVWTPFAATVGRAYEEGERGSHFLAGIGRLAPGVSLEQARADMDAVAERMSDLAPDYYDFDGWGLTLYSLHDDLVESVRPALLVLLGAVGFVLLIACVNVANLQLIRAAARQREIAVRTALGAERRRLFKQLLTESVLLATVGGVLGLGLAMWLVRALVAAAPTSLPRLDAISVEPTVLLFTAVMTLCTALLFGVAPGLVAARGPVVDQLRDGGRGTTEGRHAGRLRVSLVVAEVALALVLLIGAGLMLRSLGNLLSLDPGYDTRGILTLRVSLPPSKYDADTAPQFFQELVRRTRGLPGVEQAGAISILPLSGLSNSGSTAARESSVVEPVRGFPYPFIEADQRIVTASYFETMGMRVLSGRGFTPSDNSDAQQVAVVDDEFVRRFWPDREPLGQEIAASFDQDPDTGEVVPQWRTVVGVVQHAKQSDLGAVGREQVYMPLAQTPSIAMHLAVRTDGDPHELIGAVRAQVAALDPDQPVADVRTMQERIGGAVSQPRFYAVLLACFAGVALVLAVVGIYGVISYSVSQRTGEIGVRIALGADDGTVRTLVLRQGMLLVGVGLAIGVAFALGLSRLISALLVAVSPADPLTYGTVAVLLAVVAATACLIPAHRATRVDPVRALREE